MCVCVRVFWFSCCLAACVLAGHEIFSENSVILAVRHLPREPNILAIAKAPGDNATFKTAEESGGRRARGLLEKTKNIFIDGETATTTTNTTMALAATTRERERDRDIFVDVCMGFCGVGDRAQLHVHQNARQRQRKENGA